MPLNSIVVLRTLFFLHCSLLTIIMFTKTVTYKVDNKEYVVSFTRTKAEITVNDGEDIKRSSITVNSDDSTENTIDKIYEAIIQLGE